ncbi:sulfur carrier protein ThiS [Motiliproteus sp. SC1-56]|uniref:sulfur carrier protein ThiS n=1 Tax=Motiliproteus sp. SC1-56 TaxID=2799565 RepID=UPI001A8BFAFF
MEIELNGERQSVAAGSTVLDLITTLGLTERRIAVEYNLEILPRSEHGNTTLSPLDRVEIVHAIGGG